MKKEVRKHDSNYWISSLQKNLSYQDESFKYGCYACYFKISPKLGVKIINDYFEGDSAPIKTEEDLLASNLWAEAQKEFSVLKMVSSTKMTPRAFKVVPIFDQDRFQYFPAIIMEHIDGITFEETDLNCFLVCGKEISVDIKSYKKSMDIFSGQLPAQIDQVINSEFEKLGVSHTDLHNNNVLVCGNKLVIIDFGRVKVA